MWWRECTKCGRDFKSSDRVEKPLLCYYCFEDYKCGEDLDQSDQKSKPGGE